MRIYDAKGKWYEVDDDAVDERGLLKDGKSIRVPQYMMDHDTTNNPRVPRWAMDEAARITERDLAPSAAWAQRQAATDEANAGYKLDISNRWRGGITELRAGDVVSVGSQHGVVKSHDDGRLVIADATTFDAAETKQAAYDEYTADISSRWMRDRDAGKPRAGSECSYGGYPGHYERDAHGNLVCTPDDKSDKENVLAGPLSDEERFKVKDAAYEEYANSLREAWRR